MPGYVEWGPVAVTVVVMLACVYCAFKSVRRRKIGPSLTYVLLADGAAFALFQLPWVQRVLSPGIVGPLVALCAVASVLALMAAWATPYLRRTSK